MSARPAAVALLALLLAALAAAAGGALAQPTPPTSATPPPPEIVPTQPPIVVITQPPAGGPDLQVLSPASPLPAKERVNLFLSVVNAGPGAVRAPRVFIDPTPGSDLVVIGQAQRDLDDLPENESGLLVVRLATPDRAGSGALDIVFTFRDDAGVARSVTRTVSVQVAPPKSDPLRVTYMDAPLTTGREGNVTLLLENPSDSAITQLDITLRRQRAGIDIGSTSDELTPGASGSLVVQGGTIPAGSARRVVVPVETSLEAEDLLLFSLQASYTFEGFERAQQFDFGARLVGTVQLRVLEAREVRTPSGLELTGTLVNVGTGTAWNPMLDAAEGSGLRAEAPRLIEDLEPNDAVSFRLPVERISEPRPGAPLFTLDYNDDQGVVHPAAVEGDLARSDPPQPGAIAVWWGRIASLWFPILLALLVLAGLAIGLAHLAKKRRDEREEEDAEALAASRDDQRSRQRPGGKRGGARPGA